MVSIDKDGTVFIGSGNKVEVKALGAKLTAILNTRKDKRVFIKADRRVPYGDVMSVMGAMRREGISKVGLITEPA